MTREIVKMASRMLSSACKVIPRVCIIGAGPAGFYAAMHLTKHLDNVNIDIIEKLPVPFGLIRYGVAPDHLEVKNVINQFSKVAQQNNVNFYGNVALGKDITLNELREHYHAVLLTYGASEDRTLGIENEDAQNIIAAKNFVGWYNGLPWNKELDIDLSGPTAAILGQGNVALDVARILLTPIDKLRQTDITEHALQTLAESRVKELYLVGRRGPLQVAFTIKELREQLKLANCKTIWRKQDFEGVAEMVPNLPRPRKRLTELMLKSLNEQDMNESSNSSKDMKYFKPIFFRTPEKFLVDDKKQIRGIELMCNKLVGDNIEDQKCVPTGEKESLPFSLLFRSIGYKSVNVDKALKFIGGTLPNDKGRVIDDTSSNLAKLYVAGWLGTGPAGVILHTMGNAFQVAKNLCDDLHTECTEQRSGFDGVKKVLKTPIVDWQGWEKIDKYEIEQGKRLGKPREKICSIEDMIKVANQ